MLAAVVCALLCGARSVSAVAQWVHLQDVQTWHWLGFTRIPPGRTGFRKLLLVLSAESLEAILSRWIHDSLELTLSEEVLQAVSIDGKSLRGTLGAYQRAVHLLSALDQQTGCVLSQMRVDEGTNEHKAALDLLKTLVLKGRVIVGDAIFCQKEVCQEIRDGGGDYFVVVKDNQPTLRREIAAAFAETKAFSPLGRAAIR